MQCNSSGWSSVDRGAAFGIISYDWSNAKQQWANQQPMDCEERLQEMYLKIPSKIDADLLERYGVTMSQQSTPDAKPQVPPATPPLPLSHAPGWQS